MAEFSFLDLPLYFNLRPTQLTLIFYLMKIYNLLSLIGVMIVVLTSTAQINLTHAESPLHNKVLETIDDPSAKSLSKLQQAAVIAAIRQAGVGELAGFLEALEQSAVSPPMRIELQSLAITECGKIDPQKTLDQALPKIYHFERDSRIQMFQVFGRWAWDQPDIAEAWLDKKIATEQFNGPAADGHDRPRNGMEAELAKALSRWSKFERLDQRLGKMSESLKNDVGSLLHPVVTGDKAGAYFSILKKHLSKENVDNALLSLVCHYALKKDLNSATVSLKNCHLEILAIRKAAHAGARSWIYDSSCDGVVSDEEFMQIFNWNKSFCDKDYSSIAAALVGLIAETRRPGKFEEGCSHLANLNKDPLYEKIVVNFIDGLQRDSLKLQCKPLLASMKDPELLKKATEMIDKASKSP
jgi:hypothetical protein